MLTELRVALTVIESLFMASVTVSKKPWTGSFFNASSRTVNDIDSIERSMVRSEPAMAEILMVLATIDCMTS